jgi:hypothetical protein
MFALTILSFPDLTKIYIITLYQSRNKRNLSPSLAVLIFYFKSGLSGRCGSSTTVLSQCGLIVQGRDVVALPAGNYILLLSKIHGGYRHRVFA